MVYDKLHLVPFGEYRRSRIMEKLGFVQLTKVQVDSPRHAPLPLDILAAPRMLPLICYEAIFPAIQRATIAPAGSST